MGKHRLDTRDDRKWGGPELTSALGSREPTGHSVADQETTPMPAVDSGDGAAGAANAERVLG
jgi:hypothetical protein